MKALYRRYRPMKLGDVVGQEQVTQPLINALKEGKINHAYLFVGPRGCGKTSVARILAHEINGFKYELEDNYVDIIEIDGASNRGIDNIRELREKAAIAPTLGKYKVYIIDEVHMLTKEAFNALLKTLEEPPSHVVFIMATTDAYKVPVTITSRAQTYTFKLADNKLMFEFLKKVCEKEQIKIEDAALKIIAKRGGGSFRDSLSLLDQISTLSEGMITEVMVNSAMGLPEDEKIAQLLLNYTSGDIDLLSSNLKDLLNSSLKTDTLVEELIAHIIEHPQPALIPLLARLADVKAPFAEAKLLVAFVLSQPANTAKPVSLNNGLTAPTITKPTQLPSTSTAKTTPNAHSQAQFDWDKFVETVKNMNDAVATQLRAVEYVIADDLLDIYPTKRVVKMILDKTNNKKILIEASGGMRVLIHNVEDRPKKKDELISKLSDIMGGEVQNDGGGNPF